MRRFKKVMLMTTVIGSIGLTGAGTAQAANPGGDAPDAAIDNTQALHCEQEFSNSVVTINAPVTVLGEQVTNVGNFCTQVAPQSEN